jgi:hypothetical protein
MALCDTEELVPEEVRGREDIGSLLQNDVEEDAVKCVGESRQQPIGG